MSNIKNGGLDQYGAEPFEQQQSGTAGVEGVNIRRTVRRVYVKRVMERLQQRSCCMLALA